MTDHGHDIVRQILAWVVEERMSPNTVLGSLLAAAPGMPADYLQLELLETALRLEKMYDQVCRNEWNDWQRVDYWIRISKKGQPVRGGSAELLALKSELYRVIALVAADTIQIRRQGKDPATARDLLQLWQNRPSGYF